jgi:hypothetical protein
MFSASPRRGRLNPSPAAGMTRRCSLATVDQTLHCALGTSTVRRSGLFVVASGSVSSRAGLRVAIHGGSRPRATVALEHFSYQPAPLRETELPEFTLGEVVRGPIRHGELTPFDDDDAAAGRYLSLLMSAARSAELTRGLRSGSLVSHRANDLLRASALPVLPADDPEVVKDLEKVKRGTKLSPLLLLRGELDDDLDLTVADGYHRICASYHLDPDSEIPCRVVKRRG